MLHPYPEPKGAHVRLQAELAEARRQISLPRRSFASRILAWAAFVLVRTSTVPAVSTPGMAILALGCSSEFLIWQVVDPFRIAGLAPIADTAPLAPGSVRDAQADLVGISPELRGVHGVGPGRQGAEQCASILKCGVRVSRRRSPGGCPGRAGRSDGRRRGSAPFLTGSPLPSSRRSFTRDASIGRKCEPARLQVISLDAEQELG